MKRLHLFGWLLTLVVLVSACKKDDPGVQDRAALLTANSWKLARVTDAQGQNISQNRMGVETQALFSLEFQFRPNNVTRATDRLTRQVINGGTWYLVENNSAIDVEITQFKGRFPVRELTRNQLILGTKIPLNNQQTDANLVFEPSI